MKYALTYALFVGIAFIALTMGMYSLGWDSSTFLRNFNSFSIIFISLGIYYGIKAKRDNNTDNLISYSDAFKTGIWIAGLSGLIAGCFSYYYFKQIHPGLADIIIQQKVETMKNSGILNEKILRHVNWMRKEFSPKGQLMFNFGAFLALGTIFSAIFSFFLSEKKSVQDSGL